MFIMCRTIQAPCSRVIEQHTRHWLATRPVMQRGTFYMEDSWAPKIMNHMHPKLKFEISGRLNMERPQIKCPWKEEEELAELILLMLKCVFIQGGLRSFSTSQESAYHILDYPAISQELQ